MATVIANNKRPKADINVYQLLNPLFLWTTLQGLTPFAPKRSGFRSSKWHLCLCLAVMVIYGGTSVITIVNGRFTSEDGLIASITDRLQLYTTNVNMITAVLFACMQRNKILEVVNALYKQEQAIKTHFPESSFENKRYAIRLYAFLTGVNLYLVGMFVIDMAIFWYRDFLTSAKIAYAFICPKLICTHVVLQFCFLNITLRRRFSVLNDNLNELTRNEYGHMDFFLKDISGIDIISSHKLLEIIEKIRLHHYRLCEIAIVLNDAYGMQILFTALQVFLTLLASIFWCIRNVGLHPDNLNHDPGVMVAYTLNIVFLSFAQLGGCVFYASNTDFEARKTGSIVHKFKTEKLTKNLEFELLYFSLQLKHHNVDFNACRIFKLDESLMLSVIGVICTYLVIVIQFEFTSLNQGVN